MRRQFFEMLDSGGEDFDELVIEASARIKRPRTEQQADMSIGYVQPTDAESAAPQK